MATKKTPKKTPRKKKAEVVPIEAAKPIELPLEEVYIYKLLLLNKNFDEAKKAIVEPLKALYEQELRKRINTVVDADPGCKKAHNERVKCINEVLDKVAGSLPKGYAVSSINPEKANIVAELNPEKVETRLEELK
jgi:hypothetical protein